MRRTSSTHMISNAGLSNPANRASPCATPGLSTIASPWARRRALETSSPRNESSYKKASLVAAPGSFCRRGSGCLANAMTILPIACS
jgi:hypothetical protein